jgi:polyhydroxyalkanoate synthesis regulator phasin
MLDLFKKSILTGLGLALKTRDEAEEMARQWVKKQRMSEKEGRAFLSDVMKKYDTSMEKLEDRVEQTVKEVLKKMQIATRDELEALRREVAALRETVQPPPEGSEPAPPQTPDPKP